jgi:tRNA-specific 2-thiouridylase
MLEGNRIEPAAEHKETPEATRMDGSFVDTRAVALRKPGASVLVAMSGGVDSAVSALLLSKSGFETIGLTMKNYCYGRSEAPDRSCCSVEAIQDARRECDRLGIAHRVADVEKFFTREVIGNFLAEYARGRTPNPCVRCNTIVRFDTLLDHADRLGVDYVATGHYARVFESSDGRRFLARSASREKDQSYFLSGVRGEGLRRVLFPLGEVEKSGVRAAARNASMDVAEKPDSQEVCFVPAGGLKRFLESRDVDLEPGRVENTGGEVLGNHTGLAGYTVGQRRRLGISAGRPKYVVRLDTGRNVLVVGDPEDLLARELECTIEWIDPSAGERADGIAAQIRYRHAAAPVCRIAVAGRKGTVQFESAQRAVCPGQTIVLYRDDIVVGSGVIDATGPR